LDDELFAGLLLLKSNGDPLTVDKFTDYAKKIIDERRPDLNFKCSRGWLEKFFKRHNLEVLKSLSGKVLNIVESKKQPDPNSTTSSVLDLGDEDDCDDDNLEIDRSGEEPLVPEQVSSGDLVEQNLSEDISPPAKRMHFSTSMMDQTSLETTPIASPAFASSLVETPQDTEVKTQHISDILKKLKGSRPPLASYQKQEVIEHAKINGSRSAERKFGVPETTIRYWVKKEVSTPKLGLPMISPPTSAHASGCLPLDAATNLSGHKATPKHPSTGNNKSSLSGSISPSGGYAASNSVLTGSETLVGKGSSASSVPDDTRAAWRILHWATEQLLRDELIGFDELCDRALAHISRSNPGSAYSSTRKWVGQLLELRLRDLLGVRD